jgi:acyl-CoA dehydrogenase
MDFSIPQETKEILTRVNDFVSRELYPLEENDQGITFRNLIPTLHEKRKQVKAAGLWQPQVPQELGGMGLGFLDHAMVSEALGRSPYGHYVCGAQAPDAGNIEILIEYGSEEQRNHWLQPLLTGETRSCFSMTEPDKPGSNPVWMDTTATRDGDEYVINGHKWFTTSADGATFAVVMAVTNPEAPPHQRASLIIVPTETPGFHLVRNIPCMGHAGDDWASHGEIKYENVRVPIKNCLGEEGSGFAIAQSRLGAGRIHHCMRWIGIAERSLDLMCRRAITRNIAPGEALASRQTVQNWIAESRAAIDAARLMVLNTAWKIDNSGIKAARIDVSTCKFVAARAMLDTVDRAIQVHGALGISDDTVLQKFYRHERAARIYDGPDEVHQRVVARQILKGYGYLLS